MQSNKDEPIKVTNDDAESTTVRAADIIQYHCARCNESFWMGSNKAVFCPICMGTRITQDWVDVRFTFVPEHLTRPKTPVVNPAKPKSALGNTEPDAILEIPAIIDDEPET